MNYKFIIIKLIYFELIKIRYLNNVKYVIKYEFLILKNY